MKLHLIQERIEEGVYETRLGIEDPVSGQVVNRLGVRINAPSSAAGLNKAVEELTKKINDRAMTIDASGGGLKGGIDLTLDQMSLKTENAGESIQFRIDPAMLRQLQNALGFMPVIVSIRPMDDLPQFLGLNR